jgi:pyridinium-3,5-bisthiocarboxylic acid mononucleotide nickel chelatase
MPKIAYLDCRAGVSAPALLAALLDTGLAFDTVDQYLRSLSLSLEIERKSVQIAGIQSTSYIVRTKENPSFAECLIRLQNVAQPVRASVQAVLNRLSTAEKAVPLSEPFTVVQTFVEIVSVVSALHLSGIEQLYTSPLPLVGGILQTPNGPQIQPVPLAQELLRSVHALWQPSFEQSALVTPVAAALLAELASFEQPVMTLERTGYGFLSEKISAPLSLHLGQLIGGEAIFGGMETDQVTVIETHIDTMTGELLGALLERLLEAGALDVSYTPLQMKKNRPGTLLTVICSNEISERLALLLLRETNTLGLRIQQVQRRKAQRRQERIETPLGPMLVKIKSLAGEVISVSPEYEECLRIAKEQHLPLADVYEVARTAAEKVYNIKKR